MGESSKQYRLSPASVFLTEVTRVIPATCVGPTSMRKPLSRPKARRARDYPDIHSASSALAERHETVCGCSHSHQRRRTAPCRTPGCNLSPALDLDVKPLEPGPRHLPATV